MIKQYPDFLSQQETTAIEQWLETKAWSAEKYKDVNGTGKILLNRHKNLDMHLEGSLVRQILLPKLQKVLPSSDCTHSGFLESHHPYDLHVDTIKSFESKNFYRTKAESTGHSFLIPLNENNNFRTVFFDYYNDSFDCKDSEDLSLTVTDPSRFDGLEHLRSSSKNFIIKKQIKIDAVVKWQRGHAFSWPRNQLHCSGNFDRGSVKHALVLFF